MLGESRTVGMSTGIGGVGARGVVARGVASTAWSSADAWDNGPKGDVGEGRGKRLPVSCCELYPSNDPKWTEGYAKVDCRSRVMSLDETGCHAK